MPAKALCPQCGMKTRGSAHTCDPKKVQRESKRLSVLRKLDAK